eukprot:SM000045S16185  [mRNA]  locus=s45:114502:119797:+ [translate_table: standard]
MEVVKLEIHCGQALHRHPSTAAAARSPVGGDKGKMNHSGLKAKAVHMLLSIRKGNIGAKVQPVDGEVDERIQLVLEIPAVGKALQMHHQDLRKPPQTGQYLKSASKLSLIKFPVTEGDVTTPCQWQASSSTSIRFTRSLPHVVRPKGLFSQKCLQTRIQIDGLLPGLLQQSWSSRMQDLSAHLDQSAATYLLLLVSAPGELSIRGTGASGVIDSSLVSPFSLVTQSEKACLSQCSSAAETPTMPKGPALADALPKVQSSLSLASVVDLPKEEKRPKPDSVPLLLLDFPLRGPPAMSSTSSLTLACDIKLKQVSNQTVLLAHHEERASTGAISRCTIYCCQSVELIRGRNHTLRLRET